MSIILVKDLSIKDCTDFDISKYDTIFLIINKIDRVVIEYLLKNNLQDRVIYLINNDNIIKSPSYYLIISNFKFCVFNFKYIINYNNLNGNILQSIYFLKNHINIVLDSNYNVYSNLLKYIIDKYSEKCNNLEILNIDKIHTNLITKATSKNIIVKSLNNDSFTYDSTNYNLKFLHITKNAGTYIEDLGFNNNLVLGKINNSIEKYYLKHTTYTDYYHLPPSLFYNEVFNNNFCNSDNINFLVVRNPYDRILSELFCPWVGIILNNTTPTKDEINEYLNKKLNNYLKNHNTLFNGGHYALQYSYAYDNNNILIVDEILKLETLDEDLKKLNKNYNLNLIIDKNKTNKSSKKYQVSDLTDENIEIINEVYKLDFEMFQYPMIIKNKSVNV